MKVDHALILAAGAGTRMGLVGRSLPKVLWPVFEKSVLELEVCYAKEIGAKNIFLNVHHYKDKMLDYIQGNPAFEGVNGLVEEEAIDIGGAVHNMASKVGYAGSLLILNSDQFILTDDSVMKKAWERFQEADSLLFAYEVNSTQMYNALDIADDRLRGIVPNRMLERERKISTYTGMSLIKLESLSPAPGKSRFFETVANPAKSHVACRSIESSPYWDFGTLDRYWNSSFKVLKTIEEGKEDLFISFLRRNGAIDDKKISGSTYGGSGENFINLSEVDYGVGRDKILLGKVENEPDLINRGPAVLYRDLYEKIIF